MEGPGPVPRPALSRRDVRRARERPVGPAGGGRRLPRGADRRRHPRVLDATGTDRAILVGLCGDAVWPSIQLAASDPDRVLGIVAFAVGVPYLSPPHPWRVQFSFEDDLPAYEGWAKVNRHSWLRDYPGFARFFFGDHHRAALDEGDRRRRRLGARRLRRGDARRCRRGGPGRPSSSVEAICRRPLPDAPRPRDRGPLPAAVARASARGAHRRAAGRRGGRRPHDPGPPPGARQPAHPRLRPTRSRESRADDHPHVDPRPVPASGGCCTSPRRSGWATRMRDVAIAAELRSSTRTSRSTGSPSTR